METDLGGTGWAQIALTASLFGLLLVGVGWAASTLGEPPTRRIRRVLLTALVVVAWLAVTGGVAGAGLLRNYDALPPPMLRILLPGVALVFLAAFSPFGRSLVTGLGWGALIGFQAFRIPTELMLDALYRQGSIPVQMTFHGSNFDILTGISALAVAWLAARGRIGSRWILLWNVAGLLLLLNVVAIAILSMPGPLRRLDAGPANTIVFGWPFIWLPASLVLAALFGHLLVFRRLWRERRNHLSGG